MASLANAKPDAAENVVAYILDLGLFIAALIAGFIADAFLEGYYYGLPFRQLLLYMPTVAAAVGFGSNWFRQKRTGMFVWILPLFLFIGAACSLYRSWDPEWAGATRSSYVVNGLFGPNCSSQECVYTLPTDIFFASVLYSVASALPLFRHPRERSDAG